MGSSGTVILVSGGPGATNLNARLKGATDALKAYPGIKTIGPFFHDDDLVKAQQLTNNLLVSHPDAGAILMVAGVPFFGKMSALPEVAKNKGKVKIITTDVLAPELPFVKEGYVQALVGQDYWGWGYQTVSILHNLLTNSSCHYPALVPQAMPVVTADNVDAWIAKWKQADDAGGCGRGVQGAAARLHVRQCRRQSWSWMGLSSIMARCMRWTACRSACVPGRSSGWSATTAPENRRW